jgi:hypothetical protein
VICAAGLTSSSRSLFMFSQQHAHNHTHDVVNVSHLVLLVFCSDSFKALFVCGYYSVTAATAAAAAAVVSDSHQGGDNVVRVTSHDLPSNVILWIIVSAISTHSNALFSIEDLVW